MALFALLAAPGISGSAAEVDESKLPAAATAQIEFNRDIRPILETSCLRCHGPEKPKSGFRLDNREAALKGGKEGVDILPGNSAKSPLIHYVARLVPDSEMPPDGKGDPLTTNQIALLRAWIDQGVVWDTAAPTNLFDISISPTAGWTFVSGDAHKFREHYWRREGFDGGIEFEVYDHSDPNTVVTMSGHELLNDYKIELKIDRNELGFIHTGWDQYRKYYDDTGGLNPAPGGPRVFRLGRDLHLDNGRAWIDFGLTLPQWPKMVLGYEYDYKRGEEATTGWSNNNPGAAPPGIAPSSKQINEGVQVIKFDLDHEMQGVTIEDRFRGEFYRLNTHYTNTDARNGAFEDVREGNRYFQGANTFRLERKIGNWFFGSAGYLYSKLNADSSFTDNMNNPVLGIFNNNAPQITLERESHVFNLNGLFGPFDGFTVTTCVQNEWTHEQGFGGNLILNELVGGAASASSRITLPTTVASDYGERSFMENLGIRYGKIPWTSLFAEGKFQQQFIGYSEDGIQPGNVQFGNYLQRTDLSSRLSDMRVGFNTSPWQSVSLSAHYRRYENDSRYNTNAVEQPVGGYPGFISWRDLVTDEIETKLVLKPCTWFNTTLSYQIQSTAYREDARSSFDPALGIVYSPGGGFIAGNYDSRIYSLGTTFIPQHRLYLSTTFSYQTTITTTANGTTIAPFKGNIYSALASGTYILSESTDILLNYSFSLADYSSANFNVAANAPPQFGLHYQQHAVQTGLSHRINKSLSTRLQYGFFYYDEPTLGGAANYKAHSIFGTLTWRFR